MNFPQSVKKKQKRETNLRDWQPNPNNIVNDDDLAVLGEDDASSADEENADDEKN